jgi:hypothetical protein
MHRFRDPAVAAAALTIVLAASAGAGHLNPVLEATLDGREEVATDAKDRRIVGDPNGRGEIYVFGIDGSSTTLCYVLTVEKIAPATAAHIHKAPRGENGGVVVNLGAPFDGDAADCLEEGEILPNGNAAFPTGELVADILSHPEDYYVNVHNADHPGGAIRGQLGHDRD